MTKTENGVNPLCFGQTALLGFDVWEHSYYIDFRNKRPAYLTNFLDKLVNWENGRLAAVAFFRSRGAGGPVASGLSQSPASGARAGSFQEVQDQAGSQRSASWKEESAVGSAGDHRQFGCRQPAERIRPLPRPVGFRRGRRAGPAVGATMRASSSVE